MVWWGWLLLGLGLGLVVSIAVYVLWSRKFNSNYYEAMYQSRMRGLLKQIDLERALYKQLETQKKNLSDKLKTLEQRIQDQKNAKLAEVDEQKHDLLSDDSLLDSKLESLLIPESDEKSVSPEK